MEDVICFKCEATVNESSADRVLYQIIEPTVGELQVEEQAIYVFICRKCFIAEGKTPKQG